MQLFCLQFEASCLQWSFFAYNWQFHFFAHNWSFFAYSFSFFTESWSFLAYSGKVRLARALRDCNKQRSSTTSKEAPTVSKKAPPQTFHAGEGGESSLPQWPLIYRYRGTHCTSKHLSADSSCDLVVWVERWTHKSHDQADKEQQLQQDKAHEHSTSDPRKRSFSSSQKSLIMNLHEDIFLVTISHPVSSCQPIMGWPRCVKQCQSRLELSEKLRWTDLLNSTMLAYPLPMCLRAKWPSSR